MEKVLSFLNSATEPWLRLGHLLSAFWDVYPKCIFLSAVGVLLLYLRYLLLKPFLPTPSFGKQQGKARKRRRASFKEFRISHRETQEIWKLLSVVQSPLGQPYNASHFRQVLCPDPRCDTCNRAAAKVGHLLSGATPEDGAASASSEASTDSVTETSFTLSPPLSPSPLGCQISLLSPTPPPPPPSVISTHKVTPLEDTRLCTPQGDSPPTEPILPTSVDFPPPGRIPPHPLPTLPQTTLSTHSSTCIWFNSTPDSSVLTHPTPLSLPESQSQNLAQSQSQSVPLQPPAPVTSSSSQSQLKNCEVYFRRAQDETKALLQSHIRQLEWNATTEEERVWTLPAEVQTSQTKVCLLPSTPSLVRQSSKVHSPRSAPPEEVSLSDAFRIKLEYHLQKRLILQCWGLPQRIFKSQPWVHPDLAQSSMSSYGLSGIPFFQPQDSKDWHDTVLNQPGSSQESLSLDGKMVEAQGRSSEIVQRYPWGNSKGALDNGLPSDWETNLQRHPGSLSSKPSGTSQVSQCQENLKTALQKPLVSNLKETSKGQRAGTAFRSGHCPLPFTSCVDNEEHMAQRQSRSDNKDGHAKSTYTMTKPVLHQASMVLDNTSMKESEGNKHSPDVPRISTEAAPAPLGKRLDSGKAVLGPPGAKVNGKSVFVSDKISNIVKRGQLSVLQPQPTKILNTNQGKSTQGADGDTTKAQNTLVARRAQKEITGPQESQASDCNRQVSTEGKFKPESRLPSQALGPPRDKLPASEEFAYRHFLMSDRSPSRGPMMASQVQRQEPRMPPHLLGKDQNKDISPSVKKVWPVPWEMEELGAGVPGPGMLQANGKSYHAQDSSTQGRHGEKPTQPLLGKALTPPEHRFGKHVKHFLQWLSPGRSGKVQETFPQKGSSPPSPGKDPEHFKGRANFPRNTIAQKAMRDPGKVSKEQLGHRQSAADTRHHPMPFFPLTKPVITEPKSQGRRWQACPDCVKRKS